VATADWTYQVAPAGSPAAGLEEYVVEAASGTRVGKVTTLLRRGEEVYVAVERGSPPVTHDVRAFPWRDVDRVDHEALTVRLKIPEEDIERALELDPDKGVETEDADAVRVTELPRELAPPSATGETAGPVDRPSYVVAIGLGLLGVFSFLVLAIAATSVDFTWHFVLFAIPVVLIAAAGVTGYRLFRSPYERR
jgi:hypothetical protein